MNTSSATSDPDISPGSRRWTRRRFLHVVGRGLVGALAAALLPLPLVNVAAKRSKLRRWSDPDTWGRRVPGRRDIAVIRGKVLLDRNARVAGVDIRPGSELIFDPRKRLTLRTSGNVLVHGKLVIRPRNPRVVHRLLFTGVNESRFVGGGMNALRSDIGLWVMDHGRLDIRGTSKLAWTRSTDGVSAGATWIELQEDPAGWQVGDEIVLTPTENPAIDDHYARYDQATIAAISGRSIQLSTATTFAHPAADVSRGTRLTPEVLNLSRNVLIEGTPQGRAHVFIHSMHRQSVRYMGLRYAGPRQRSTDPETIGSKHVLGRYGLHFHHCGNGSRGSVVDGVVVRDCGSSAFVPHSSHGITFTDCISHNTYEEPFWWDTAERTDDTVWEACVASRGLTGTDKRTHAFVLGVGVGNQCIRCVAVGSTWQNPGSGFHWPSRANNQPNVWRFEDCVSHNNRANGIYAWQNDGNNHVISRFVAYRNGESGIVQGAYRNRYIYDDVVLHGNGAVPMSLHANSKEAPELTFRRVTFDASGKDYAVTIPHHVLPPEGATRWEGCRFTGYRKAGLHVNTQETDGAVARSPDLHIVAADCTFDGNELWIGNLVHPATEVHIQGRVARRRDQPGIVVPEWNASLAVL